MGYISLGLLDRFAAGISEKIDSLFVRKTRKINGKSLNADITLSAADIGAIAATAKGAVNGIAELDAAGKVPAAQLPSYVDDVVEGYLYNGKLYKEEAHITEIAGETGKIYIDLTASKTYRWSGTGYAPISDTIALGETSATAYRGDRGKIAFEHSQSAHAPSDARANVQSDWNVTDTASDAYIKNKPSSLPANGGNASTVNGYTVNANVPSGAKFTDTIYNQATTVAAGLMSAADKEKLDEMAEASTVDIDNIIAGIFS